MRNVAEVAIRAGKGYGADSCAVFAGGVTYFALLSLFPLTLFALSITGFIFSGEGDQQRLVENLLDSLPIDEGSGRQDLEDVISNVVDARGALGLIGLLGSAYSASALFGAVRTALNAVLHSDRKRPFFISKAMDILAVLFFSTLLLLSVAVTFGITLARQSSEDVFGEEAATWTSRLLTLAYAFVPTLVSSIVFFLLYALVPAERLKFRAIVWGAVTAAALFEALKIGFAYYATNFGNFNATYGTLGFVIVLLVFFNFSSQIMLLGAEVARARSDMDHDEGGRYRESQALRDKAYGFLAKVPLLGRRFPHPAEGEGRLAALAHDQVEAAPVVAVTVPAAVPEEPVAPASRETAVRPSALASLAFLASSLVAVLTLLRRK